MTPRPDLKLIDAHSHINFNAYKDDAEEVIGRALDQGVGMFAVGSQSTTSARAVDYAERHDGIWAVVGLHPTHLFSHYVDDDEIAYKSREESFDPEYYRGLVRRSKKVIGIGECGLDYYRMPDGVDPDVIKTRQQTVFRAHIDLALGLAMPIMVHCRDAHADLATILEEYAADGKKVRGDIHCFTGTWAEAERYLKLGFYISFTGVITFPPRKAPSGPRGAAAETQRSDGAAVETLQDVVKNVPLERLLVETDAPYLAPVPFRGKRNEPAYVRHVAEQVAALKGLPYEQVAAQTLKNTLDLFHLG